jgi:hypothetical protein
MLLIGRRGLWVVGAGLWATLDKRLVNVRVAYPGGYRVPESTESDLNHSTDGAAPCAVGMSGFARWLVLPREFCKGPLLLHTDLFIQCCFCLYCKSYVCCLLLRRHRMRQSRWRACSCCSAVSLRRSHLRHTSSHSTAARVTRCSHTSSASQTSRTHTHR